MGEERLDNLVLMNSKRDHSSGIELPVLVDQFAARKVIYQLINDILNCSDDINLPLAPKIT